MNFYDLAAGRRSIRKFENTEIPDSDIDYFIKCAVTAPSGCNSQCWQFVAVKDMETISKISVAAEEAVDDFYTNYADDNYISGKKKAVTYFKNAPLIIAVFMSKLVFYDSKTTDIYAKKGYSHEKMMRDLAFPDVLSIGAAVQNLLLAVHEKGYGAVWMNDPAIAGVNINKLLDIPDENRFMSIIPIGLSAYSPRNKQMKDKDEVFKLIK